MRYSSELLPKFPIRFIYGIENRNAISLGIEAEPSSFKKNVAFYTDGKKKGFKIKLFIPPESDEIDKYF